MDHFIELKKQLAIDEYLELIKEDKNLSMAYVSLGQYIKELEEEIESCDYIINKQDRDMVSMSKGNHKLKNRIDKTIKYLTSYSSIHTIQFGTENDSLNDIELNKTLDEKTLNEMTNRYLKVHDKLLKILKGKEVDMERIRSAFMYNHEISDDEKNFREKEALCNLFITFINEFAKDINTGKIDNLFDKNICFKITRKKRSFDNGDYLQEYELQKIEVIQNDYERVIIPRTEELLNPYSTYKKATFKERIKILFKGKC